MTKIEFALSAATDILLSEKGEQSNPNGRLFMDEKAFEEKVDHFLEVSESIIKTAQETNETAGSMNKLMDDALKELAYLKGQNEQLEKRVEEAKDWMRWTAFSIATIIIGLLVKIAFFSGM